MGILMRIIKILNPLLFSEQKYIDIITEIFIFVEESELKRTLQSLACGKYLVLNKTPKSLEVQSSDSFKFNKSFTYKLYRLKINQVQMKETVIK